MSDTASLGTLTASVQADVSQYLQAMKQAADQAGATVEALEEIAESTKAAAEAMDEAASSAEAFGGSSAVSMSAAMDVASQLGDALVSMGKAAIDAANQMDPKGAEQWNKSVTDAKNAAMTLAGTLGKELRPILEEVMAEATKAMHFIGSISFKKMGDDAKFVAKEIWDELSQLGKKLDGWSKDLGEMLRSPFNAMIDAVLASVEGALDLMGNVADFAKDKLHLGEGGAMYHQAAKSVDQYGGRDHAADIAAGVGEAAKAVGDAVKEAVGVAASAYVGPAAGPDHDFSKPAVDAKQIDAEYAKIDALQQAIDAQSAKAHLDAARDAAKLQLEAAHQGSQDAQAGFEQAKSTLEQAYKNGSSEQINAAQQAVGIALQGVNEAGAQIINLTSKSAADAAEHAAQIQAAAAKADADVASARVAWKEADTEANRQMITEALEAQKAAHAEAITAAHDAAEAQMNAAKAAGDEARKAAKDSADIEKAGAEEAERARKNARAIVEHEMAAKAAHDNAVGGMVLGAEQKVPVLGGILSGAMSGAQAGPEGAIAGAALAALEQSKAVGEVMSQAGKVFQFVIDSVGSMIKPLLDIPGPLKVALPLLEGGAQMLAPITSALTGMWEGIFNTAPLMQKIGSILAGHFGKEIQHVGAQLSMIGNEMGTAFAPAMELFLKGVDMAVTAMGPGVIRGLEVLAGSFKNAADIILWTASEFDQMGHWVAQMVSRAARLFGDDDLANKMNDLANALWVDKYNADVARSNMDALYNNPPTTSGQGAVDPLGDNTKATNDNTKAMQDAMTSISNSPSGFRAALAEFQAINTNPFSDPTSDHYDPRNDPSSPDYAGDMHSGSGNTTRSLHRTTALGGGSGSGEVVNIQQLIVYANDPAEFLRKLQDEIRRGHFNLTGSVGQFPGSPMATR